MTTPSTQPPAAVQVTGISKHYGNVQALNPTSFSVPQGSYFVLLGPSGGGKTTTLRLIGGLVKPSSGSVTINGVDVTHLAANHRDTTMVFQSYALFPHMSVSENVAYGLRLKKLATAEIQQQVTEMLEKVGLKGFDARMPHELSGGQQQRVQLARSLILKSSVLLLDEPLAALDANLRKSMCIELKRLQESVGITFIHVTHNQEEAMTIADEIALIANGDLIESGSVRQIYETPKRRFTAEFIGESTILDGTVISSEKQNQIQIDLGFSHVQVAADAELAKSELNVGDKVAISLRSESAKLLAGPSTANDPGINQITAEYCGRVYLGFYTNHLLKLANGVEMSVRTANDDELPEYSIGDSVTVQFSSHDVRLHVD